MHYDDKMTRTPATPAQRAKVRHKIRQAAADIYNNEGPGSVSARAIAKKADVSVGTIYTYFGSLRGLMESLWSGPIAKYTEQLQSVSEGVIDPVERLRKLMETYVKFALENVEIYRGVFLFVRPLNIDKADKTPVQQAVFVSMLIKVIEDGQANKKFVSGNAADIAVMIWGGLHGCLALPNNFTRSDFGGTEAAAIKLFTETVIARLEA